MKYVADAKGFAEVYIAAFKSKLEEVQEKYRAHRRAFDDLFVHRPFDAAGSGAYRWAKTLERLDRCDPAQVADYLRSAINA